MNAFLVQAALRGALILIAAFAAAAVLRRSSAAMRSLVWTAAFAALAALPAAMLTLPKWSPAPAVAAGVLAPGGRGGMASISSIPGAKIPAGAFLVAPDAAPRAGEFPWPLAVWALGCAAFAAWFLLGFWRASRMVRLAGPAAYAGGPAEEARAALGMRRAARIVQSSAAPISLAWGILRPAVILPSGARDWPEARLRAALLHELAHAQRFDLAAQAIAQAACCLYWFNPLVWMVARMARNDCELACDESILRRLTAHERESYGATLLKIVSLANCGTPPPLGLGVVESKQQIKRRIQMIVAQPSSTLARAILGCALFSLVVGISLTCETSAQPTSADAGAGVAPVVRTIAAPESSPPKVAYDPSTDALSTLFPNGIVATVGDQVITVEDVRREMKPLIPQLQREARSQDDFNQRLNRDQNYAIQALISRVLLIKEFHNQRLDFM